MGEAALAHYRFAVLGAGVLAAASALGCDLTRFTANQSAGMFKIAGRSLDMEADLELAREAAPGLIKTVDGLALVSPENHTLLELSAQAYCSYAFGFLEDDLEALPQGDP